MCGNQSFSFRVSYTLTNERNKSSFDFATFSLTLSSAVLLLLMFSSTRNFAGDVQNGLKKTRVWNADLNVTGFECKQSQDPATPQRDPQANGRLWGRTGRNENNNKTTTRRAAEGGWGTGSPHPNRVCTGLLFVNNQSQLNRFTVTNSNTSLTRATLLLSRAGDVQNGLNKTRVWNAHLNVTGFECNARIQRHHKEILRLMDGFGAGPEGAKNKNNNKTTTTRAVWLPLIVCTGLLYVNSSDVIQQAVTSQYTIKLSGNCDAWLTSSERV